MTTPESGGKERHAARKSALSLALENYIPAKAPEKRRMRSPFAYQSPRAPTAAINDRPQ